MGGGEGNPKGTVGKEPAETGPTTSFGRYQLFASLGRGGMADVFLAVARGQIGITKLAVIKRLRQSLAEEPSFRTMFLDEARLASRLGHPNIVHTYEVGEQAGTYFIAMEYLEGQSLNKVLKEAHRRKVTLEPTVAARIVADALAGLGYAHELRDYDGRPLAIVHRDVSPHNVFVTYDGHTKLVDFGIAKAALSTAAETEVGVLKGKVAYMAPEQAAAAKLDARSDLFAMGIVLWELVAQDRLLPGETAANTLHKLMNEPIRRLSSARPGVDPALERIVMRALEKDPDRRFASAAEMRSALEAWLVAQPSPARQEDVARVMAGLFANVRAEVERQIERAMAAIAAEDAAAMSSLSDVALHPNERDGSGEGSLAPTGTASGSQALFTRAPPVSPSLAPEAPRTHNALLVAITIGCFTVAAALILVVGLRGRAPSTAPTAGDAPAASPLATVPPVLGGAGESSARAEPVAPPSPPVVLSQNAPTAPSTPRAPSPAPDAPVDAPVAGSSPVASPRSSPHVPPKPASRAAEAAPAEPGLLTVSSIPWSRVTEAGRSVCEATPCVKVKLAPGTHVLTFENAEQGLRQTVPVTIRSGEETKKIVALK